MFSNSRLAGSFARPGQAGSDLMRMSPMAPTSPVVPTQPLAPRSTMPQPKTFAGDTGGADYPGGGQSLTVPTANPFDRLGAASPVATSWNRSPRYFSL